MSIEPQVIIKIKFWKHELGPEDLRDNESSGGKRYSNLDSNMSIVGEFSFDGQFNGTIGVKTDYWDAGKDSPITIDYIGVSTIKIFDSDNKWIGTIKERLIDEIIQSYKSDPKLVFLAEFKGAKSSIIMVQKGDYFIFPFQLVSNSKKIEFFTLDKKYISIGDDWTLKRCVLGDIKAGDIDSKRGKKIVIKVFNEELSKNQLFLMLLTLFASTIPYQNEMRERIRTYSKAIKEGTLIMKTTEKIEDYAGIGKKSTKVAQKKPSKKSDKKINEVEKTNDIKDELDTIPEKKKLKQTIKKDIKKGKTTISSKKTSLKEESKEQLPEKEDIEPETERELAFKIEDPIEKAPGIGKKTGARFREIGIKTIGDFINADIDELYEKLPISWITKSKLRKWQRICFEYVI